MSEIGNKIVKNIFQQYSNLDLAKNNYESLYISTPIPITPKIDYYQSPTSLNISPPINHNISLYNFDNEIFNNQNSSIQTPVMNLNINNETSETNIRQNNQNEIKTEVNSCDTNESSKNMQIEILPKIENIVSTANLCCKLNLREIAMQAKNAEYNPKRFSAVIMKIKEPKTTALIFSSGRIVTLGAKTEEDSRKSCRKFAKIIKSLNFQVTFKEFKIQNIVGSVDIKFQLSLMRLYMHLIKNSYCKGKNYVVYEPEQFPGLIYRMIEPNIVLLIFVSGKIVLTGGKTRDDIYQGFRNIYPLLVKFKNDNNMKNNKMLHQDNVKKMKELERENILI